MQLSNRVRLVIAYAATSMQLVSASAFAQPPSVESRTIAEIALPEAQIESIDATAKTVALRALKPSPGASPLETPDGVAQIIMVAGELETIPINAGASIVRVESALPSYALRIGDLVSLLGQKPTPGQIKIQLDKVMQREALTPQFPAILQPLGSARYGSKAEFFSVIALKPLTLRKGGEPTVGREENVLSVPFTNGPDSPPIGMVSVGTREGDINLQMRQGSQNGPNIPAVIANYVVTLNLSKPEGLEFDRFSPLKLSDVAAEFALGKIRIAPEIGRSPAGNREITRMVISIIQ